MKYIAISILASTLILTSWLFYNTNTPKISQSYNSDAYLKIDDIELELQKQSRERLINQKKIEELVSKLEHITANKAIPNITNMSKYKIFTMELGGVPRTFLLNTESGETWRYYINSVNGKQTSEGWSFLNFNAYGLDFASPTEAKMRIEGEIKK